MRRRVLFPRAGWWSGLDLASLSTAILLSACSGPLAGASASPPGVPWPGGGPPAEAAQVAGRYAFVAGGERGLAVLDLADPAQPRQVAECQIPGGTAHALQAATNLVFVAAGAAGLQVFDATDPVNPKPLGRCVTSGPACALHVLGRHAYVALGDTGLDIIDVEAPAQPNRLGGYSTKGRASALQALGSHLYVVDNDARLLVLNVSDPAMPRPAGSCALGGWGRGLEVVTNRAYVAEGYAGLEVFDVTNPAQPGLMGAYPTSGFAEAVKVADRVAFLTAGAAGVEVVEVTDPAQPRRVGAMGVRGVASAISLAASQMFVAEGGAGSEVIDVSDPAQPLRLSTLASAQPATALWVAGGFAYLAAGENGWQMFDLSDPAQPRPVGPAVPSAEVWEVRPDGRYAYLAGGVPGLRVLDLAVTPQLQLVGEAVTSGRACALEVAGSLVFVAEGPEGVEVFDVSEPGQPRRVAACRTSGDAVRLRVAGGYAYVADGAAGLTVLDAADPARLRKVGGCAVGSWANDVKLAASYALVAAGGGGLAVVDVSNPSQPRSVGRADTPGWAHEVALLRGYAYVAADNGGLAVFDLSDPSQPALVGNYALPAGAVRVQVAADRAYVAGADGSLASLALRRPQRLQISSLTDRFLDESPFTVSATADSGLPVSLEVISGPATLSSNGVSLTGLGYVALRLQQPGNEVYAPVSVARAFEVLPRVRYTGPWDMAELMRVPTATWGTESNGVRAVYYEGVPFQGRSTRVFAYYAHPTNTAGPWPALLLAHGAGLHADAGWAAYWAQRGYAALAMDLAGWDAKGHMSDGGPDLQTWNFVIDALSRNSVTQTWHYQAVAAIVRGHALLTSLPQVDTQRIGVHGISWGGVLSCIVAGIDDQIRLAVPVYGAGYLYLDEYRKPEFSLMTPAVLQRWIDLIDPASYLPYAACPMLFVTGATDFYFSLPTFQLSYQAVPGGSAIASVRPKLSHGMIYLLPSADLEVRRFVDAQLLNGPPLPRLGSLSITGQLVSASVSTTLPLTNATLWFTTNLGPWTNRLWTARPATLTNGFVTAQAPSERPLTCFLAVTDQGAALVSSPYVALPAVGPPVISEPQGVRVLAGGRTTLAVELSGRQPLYCQWFSGATAIPGATNAELVLLNAQLSDAGPYRVVVSNSLGSVTSQVAQVVVGYGLAVRSTGYGSVQSNPSKQVYEPGATVQLVAAPQETRAFLDWHGDAAGNANPLLLTMDFHKSVVAEFSMNPGDKKWEALVGGGASPRSVSSPALGADGTLYVGSDDGKLCALNAVTGAKLWEFQTGGAVSSSPAVGAEGLVYVGSLDGKVYALNAVTGAKLWAFATGNSVSSSPAVGADGTVYAGSWDYKVYALNGMTGAKLWEFATGNAVVSSPAVGPDGTIYIGSRDNKVYALNGATGAKLWEFATGNWVESSPALGPDGTIYVGSYDCKVYALKGATGAKLWQFETRGAVSSSPVVGLDGTIYIGSWDQKLYALSRLAGAKLWEYATAGSVLSSPSLAADGTVFAGSADRKVYALDARTGLKRWEFLTGGQVIASPTIGPDGATYVSSGDGKLYALFGNSPPAAASWPVFRQNATHWGRASYMPPALVTEAVSLTVAVGDAPQFQVLALGAEPLSYQWRFQGTNLPGATEPTLALPGVGVGQGGGYDVVVTNGYGAVTSRVAMLVVRPSKLLACWELEGGNSPTAWDAEAGRMHGAVFGAAETTGIAGRALTFDGQSTYVDVPNYEDLNFSGPITLSAWVKTKSRSGLQSIFAHGYAENPRAEVCLRLRDGFYEVGSWDGVTAVLASTPVLKADLGVWVHLAGVYDGVNWIIYRNGELKQSLPSSFGAVPVQANWAIGARAGGGDRHFAGEIDDVRVYRGALSAGEVGDLFAAKWLLPGLIWDSGTAYLGFSLQDGRGDWSWQQDATPTTAGSKITGTVDFTGDGYPDVLFQRQSGDRSVAMWTMQYATKLAATVFAPPDDKWKIAAAADFDGDGYNDTLWRHESGWLGLWLMKGTNSGAAGRWVGLGQYYLPGFEIAGAADLTGDGQPDLVWQHPDYGAGVWPMNGTNIVKKPDGQPEGISLGQFAGRDWWIAGLGDFTHDGRPELLLRNLKHGALDLWTVDEAPLTARKVSRLAESSDLRWRLNGFYMCPPPATSEPFALRLTSPVDGTTLSVESDVSIKVELENPGLSTGRVEFFADSGSLGTVFAAPYACSWRGASTGRHVITAKGTDALGRVVYSSAAVITLCVPGPLITKSPESLELYVGQNASFKAEVAGCPPLSYRWQLNGQDLTDGGRVSGAVTAELRIAPAETTEAGKFTLIVTNQYGAVTSTVASLTVRNPLLGHWPLDGDGQDASGQGNNGAVRGGQWVSSAAERALSLNGAGDYVEITNCESLNFTGPITLAAWVKPRSSAGIQNVLVHGHALQQRAEVCLRLRDGFYEAGSWDGTTAVVASAPVPVTDLGAWVHLAGVYDGANWLLYRNGELQQQRASPIGAVPVEANWAIGGRAGGTERFFAGEIDDARIYWGALNAGTVADLFAAKRAMPGLLWEHSGKFLGFSAQDDQGNWSWLQYALQSPIIGWKFAGTADFTGEGYPDVLFQRQEGKYEVALWTMNGPSVAASSVLAYPDPKWKIAGTGDFDGDGYNDTFWQHETGWLGIWLMRGTNSAAAGRWVQLEHYSMTGHQIAGAADLTGDGRPDLVWQHPESGVTVWPMEGTNIVKQAGGQAAGVSLGLLAGRGWAVVAMGDFTRDGRVDLLLRNASTGGLELWSVSGPPLAARKLVRLAESGDLNWRAVGFFASRLPTNAKPFAAQLTSPTDSAAFKAPAEFAITAALENPGLSCARVEFFEGSQRVGIAYAAPYTCGWHATVPGTYVYTAKATDALGRVVYSPAAVVTVR